MAIKGTSQASYVARGYGQVEPNFLTAPQNGQVFAQLPAAADINVLENGQFVKYDMANGVCNFTGAGPWRMVFNEVKIYRDRETDADFAMFKNFYNARVYSPVGQSSSDLKITADYTAEAIREGITDPYAVTMGSYTYGNMMPAGTRMVPRVIAIPVGDYYTTNMINADATDEGFAVGKTFKIGEKGILELGTAAGGDEDPEFTIVKIYTMPDLQPGVKIQRTK
jgi:hypothetical protein